ncbi:unnamed protein product, partial [Brassica rapa subsp. narinosa]
MGEASEQATMMQVLNALREEMRVMRQDLGERMTRVEQRPPPLQPVRNVDRFLNPNNRRYGVPVHDNPETSTRNQQTDEDTGQQHGPIPNQRAGLQPDDYGEEEEEEGFAPPPRAPRRQNRHQGFEEEELLPQHRAPRQQNYNQGPEHIKMNAPGYAGKRHVYADMKDLFHLAIQAEQHIKKKSSKGKSQVSWNSSNSNYNKSVDKGKGVEGDSRPKPRTTEPTKDNKTEPAKTTNPQRARDITCFKCRGRGHMARECPNQRVMLLTDDGYESRDEGDVPEIQEEYGEVEYADVGE